MGRQIIHWDDEWFTANIDKFSTLKELFCEYNNAHGTNFAYHTMKSHIYSVGIKAINSGSSYSDAEIQFFKQNYSNMFTTDFIAMFEKNFNKKLTKGSATALAIRLGLKKTDEQIQRALLKTLESTTYPDGTMGYLAKGKYETIKVDGKWMLRSRYEYQQLTGDTLTDNDAVIFADGDQTNYSVENLIKVPARYVTLMYSTLGISNDAKELVDAAIVWCDLYTKIKEVQAQ